MGRNQRNAHADQNGGAGGGHDAVGGGGGHAHTQDDAADHGQEQGNEYAVPGQDHNTVDDHIGQACHGNGTGNDAGNATGGSHSDGALSSGGQSLQEAHGGDPGLPAEKSDDDAGHDGEGGGILDALLAGADQVDQQNQRQQQIALFQQRLQLRQFFLRQALQPNLFGLQVDGDENTGKVQQCGQYRLQCDLTVGELDIVRHQEGGSTHDGGHDLSAGRGGGFRSSGKLRLVARLFHQRNGYGSRAHGIRHGRSGDNALQSAGYYGNLGRTAGEPANQPIGNLNKVIRNAGALQKCAKDDKHHNKLGADIDGRGENALLPVEQIPDGIVQLAPERGVGQAHGQGIRQEAPGHNEDGQANASAAHLCQSQNADDADDDLVILEMAALLDNGLGVKGII